jgi:hypothetical protein
MSDNPYVSPIAFWIRPIDQGETVVYEIDLQNELDPENDTIASVVWTPSTAATAAGFTAPDDTTATETTARCILTLDGSAAIADVHAQVFDIVATITTTNGRVWKKTRQVLVYIGDESLLTGLELLNLHEMKAYLSIQDNTFDPSLVNLEQAVRGYLEEATEIRIVGQVDQTEIFCGTGLQFGIWLSQEPTDGFTDFTVEIRATTAEPWVVQTDAYELITRREVVRSEAGWPSGYNNVRITYKAGWDVIPERIKKLALEIVGKSYRERPSITPSQRVGQETIIPLRVPTTAQTTIDSLRPRVWQGIGRG